MTWYESLEPAPSIEVANRTPIPPLESVRKAVDELAQGLAVMQRASRDAGVRTPDAGLRRMQAFVSTLARLGSTSLERAAGSFAEASFRADTNADLSSLLHTRAQVRRVRGACHAFTPLIRVQYLRLQAASSRGRPAAGSLVARAALAIVHAETHLAAVVWHLDRTLAALERVICLATRAQDSRIIWPGGAVACDGMAESVGIESP